MDNPFSPGDRVIVTDESHAKGMTGVITKRVDDEYVFVKLDGEELSWGWHWTHFAKDGEPVSNYALWQ